MPVSCSNEGCDEVVSKRDVKRHEIELCRFKTTTCDDCGKKMPHHKYAAHGCVLRCDVDEMKKDLAEMKVKQHEMMNEMREGMQRITIAIEKLEKSSRNVANVVNSMNSDIVLIGGVDRETEKNKALSSVERFNFFNQTWKPLAELKIGRVGLAAVVFENQIFVCGGVINVSSGDYTDSIEVLDLNVNPPTWQEFAVKLPIEVVGHKCVVYGNRLLIIGGETDESTYDAIYELLLVPPYSSQLLCRMKKERTCHGVEIFNDKVLIAGGQGAETDVEIFDITRNECIEMPPLPSPLWLMTTVRRDETMLLVGGKDKENKFSNEIIEYDFKSGQSKVLVVMEKAGAVCSAVHSGNTLVVISAADDGDPCSVDCFNFLSNSWKKLPSITKTRVFAPAVVVNNFEY
jgi:hypothetical protein